MERLKEKDSGIRKEIQFQDTVIGVLALQGAFREHIRAIKKGGIDAIEIKFPKQLEFVDGLIIPGGESTTIYKLIEKYNFKPGLERFYKAKKPIFGTCAGLILLAEEVLNDSFGLGFIDITVDRNAYGRQVESFEQPVELEFGLDPDSTSLPGNEERPAGLHKEFNAVFIRAPRIKRMGKKVQSLGRIDSIPVLARQDNVLVCAFHPELTDDLRIHQYFIDMVIKHKNMLKLDSDKYIIDIVQ